ncbi:MAG: serine--tRNA ligase, partial [Planctomycetaceae bacterium]|nr:serine--tRNA ligase [Planctomycetaceae bacterium]
MIDLKDLRENPDRYIEGARAKGSNVDIPKLLELDAKRREALSRQESARAEQKRISKEIGPQIGKLKGQLKKVDEADRPGLEAEIAKLEAAPAALKQTVQAAEAEVAELDGPLEDLL